MTPDAQTERLVLLAEELCEAGHIINKILRHGMESHHPDKPAVTNAETLLRELGDVLFCLRLMDDCGDINMDLVEQYAEDKARRVTRYMHHDDNVFGAVRLHQSTEIRSETMDHSKDVFAYMVQALISRGVPIEIDNVAEASCRPSAPCDFGTLERLGVLSKEYYRGDDPDHPQIRWIVEKDVEIVTESGKRYRQGDIIDWPILAYLAK